MTSRSELRAGMRKLRRAFSLGDREKCSEAAARRFAATRRFRCSRHIACYLANDGELDPLPLMQRAWAARKTCYLPVLSARPSQRLWFAPYREGDTLVYNRYGILEPDVPVSDLASAWMLDLIMVPLVAFDGLGNRLGMGAGFYDHTFAFLKYRRHWQSPRLFGLAYEFQKVPHIQAEPWDVPMQGVITEAGLYPSP